MDELRIVMNMIIRLLYIALATGREISEELGDNQFIMKSYATWNWFGSNSVSLNRIILPYSERNVCLLFPLALRRVHP